MMKSAYVIILILLSLPVLAQSPMSGPDETASIHGNIAGVAPNQMCSVELLKQDTGVPLQRVGCGLDSFEFRAVRRGEYILVLQVGTQEVQQTIEVEMGDTRIDLRLPEPKENKQSLSNATVSVAEMQIPTKAKNLFEKASTLLQESKLAEAQQKLQEALKISPQFPRAMALQAVILARNNDLTSALQQADRAANLDPQLPFVQFVHAMVLNSSGKFKDANRAAEQGLQLEPSSWRGHFELAHSLLGLGQMKDALREATRAEQGAPKEFNDVHLLKAIILFKSNLEEQARQELSTLQKHGVHDPRIQQLDAMFARH